VKGKSQDGNNRLGKCNTKKVRTCEETEKEVRERWRGLVARQLI
jgi:hypothetical protein